MQEEKTNSTTFLYVLLAIVIVITIGLGGLYFYYSSGKSTAPGSQSFLSGILPGKKVSPTPVSTISPVEISIYEGYVQELSQKEKTVGNVTYTYVIGLLGKEGDSIPVWITESEYNNMKFFDSRRGSKVAITLDDIKGGQYLRVTRTLPVGGVPQQGSIEIELI
jgi:hypothetical protein